jgi:hypothetical protein
LNENLGNNVPADVHFALKNKMKDMMKRHAEFQSLLLYAGPEGSQCSPHALPLNPSPSVLGTHMDDPNVFTSARQRRPTATASNPNPILRNPLTSTPISKRKTKSAGEFHDQADATWIGIRRSLWGHNDTPFRRTTPGRPIGHPGVGRPSGVIGVFSYY